MDISNIFLLYDGDGSLESPFSVPVVGLVVRFVEASVSVVISVKPVALVWPSVGVGVGVGRFKQLQIKNHNITEEVVQKLNKPDTNYAGVMAPVTQQPCIIKKFHSSLWKQVVGKYS